VRFDMTNMKIEDLELELEPMELEFFSASNDRQSENGFFSLPSF